MEGRDSSPPPFRGLSIETEFDDAAHGGGHLPTRARTSHAASRSTPSRSSPSRGNPSRGSPVAALDGTTRTLVSRASRHTMSSPVSPLDPGAFEALCSPTYRGSRHIPLAVIPRAERFSPRREEDALDSSRGYVPRLGTPEIESERVTEPRTVIGTSTRKQWARMLGDAACKGDDEGPGVGRFLPTDGVGASQPLSVHRTPTSTRIPAARRPDSLEEFKGRSPGPVYAFDVEPKHTPSAHLGHAERETSPSMSKVGPGPGKYLTDKVMPRAPSFAFSTAKRF